MANYEGNRIRCSKTTANHLITSKGDGYYKPIDFRKALDLEPGTEIPNDVSYMWSVAISELEDGRMGFGFNTRWFSNLEVIKTFITKYQDAEWWIDQEGDIYHYYWLDGEVIEDTRLITDEEDEYLSALLDQYDEAGDDEDHFDMIFTEKLDQSQYVNFHPDVDSEEYQSYMCLVNRIAQMIVDEDEFYALNKHDYRWSGASRYYYTQLGIRLQYLYEMEKDLSKYKLNIMSADVLDAIERIKFPDSEPAE